MKQLIICLAIGLSFAPPHADAQGRARQIGYLSSGSPPGGGGFNPMETIREGLAEAGYVVGQTLVIHERYAAGKDHLLSEFATELVRRKPDLMITVGDQATAAARRATRDIPIVMAVSTDPVGVGLVASLARPGGNVTGLTTISPELGGKRLELLKQVVPRVGRVAVLWNANNPGKAAELRELEAAAQRLAIAVWPIEVRSEADFERAFRTISLERADALLTLREPLVQGHQKQIVQFAARNRLPDMHVGSEWADDGGLMAYGPSLREIFRRSAVYVDKILKGAKPADLPIERPTRFELVINLKTAKALGLTIPPPVVARADRLIE
jgi:putative tryptophan/tyrosine transport system substrate-binding protein